MATTTAPYGTWPSPIDAALVASHDGRPEYLGTVGDETWWTEPRPQEDGRRALMRRPADGQGSAHSVLPPPWNVRNRVIEYGGLPWAGTARPEGGPLIVFTHFADQRLYAYEPDRPDTGPRPLTPLSRTAPGGLRWCDPVIVPGSTGQSAEVWCVLEEFTGEGPTDLRRLLAAVPLDGSAAEDRTRVRELTGDTSRFLTGPRISPDRTRLAWLAWDHPAMPWDGTEVKYAHITGDGSLTGIRVIAGGPEESVAQVEWAPDGTLLLATDTSGWWNLQRLDPAAQSGQEAVPRAELCPRQEEFASGLWRIGLTWFVPLEHGLIATLHGRGAMRLGILDTQTGDLTDAPGPWTEWSGLTAAGSRITGVAAGPHSSHEIVELDICTGHSRVVAHPHHDPVDPAHYPQPEARTFRGPDGRDIHAQVYPPHHPEYSAPDDELPPYAVWAHGGPTSRAPLVLDLEIAYFTSRGIGVVEVNYGGSTGYGREYRNRLREQWGIVDVEDCAAVARAMAAEGSADPARLAIRGGSAGGWTAAASLTTPATEGLYACGAISYPILDLTDWATGGTHDFESQYLESLVGPLAAVPDRYHDRSPLQYAERVSAPFLLLQGLDDVICPPAQGERFLERVSAAGVPHAYLSFEGESHGFRRAATIVKAVEAELSLYRECFGIADAEAPVLELRR